MRLQHYLDKADFNIILFQGYFEVQHFLVKEDFYISYFKVILRLQHYLDKVDFNIFLFQGYFEVTTLLGQGRFEYCFSVDGKVNNKLFIYVFKIRLKECFNNKI